MDVFSAYEVELQSTLREPASTENQAVLEDLLKQMSLEARGVSDATQRQQLQDRLNRSKASVASRKHDLDLSALMSSSGDPVLQKERIVQDKIAQQNAAILAAHKSVAESEEVGADIVFELGRNREKIATTQAKAGELKGEIDHATARLKSMENREKCTIA
jgi:Vesicle transport v-SNARE protein N-terminus